MLLWWQQRMMVGEAVMREKMVLLYTDLVYETMLWHWSDSMVRRQVVCR